MGKSSPGAYCCFGILAAATLGTVMVEARSQEPGYLASNYMVPKGPVPLRFQLQRISKPVPLPPLVEESTNAPTAEVSQSPEPDSSIAKPASGLTLPDDGVESMLPPLANSTTNSFSLPSTANDLLIITPQMLVDYFRPMHGSTNGMGYSIPVPVNFLPPLMPPVGAPVSSSATYKVQ